MLDLSPPEELVAIENIDILRANGFEIKVDEEAPPGHKLKLVAQPISKDIVFDVKGW